jgi:hypothetical protein
VFKRPLTHSQEFAPRPADCYPRHIPLELVARVGNVDLDFAAKKSKVTIKVTNDGTGRTHTLVAQFPLLRGQVLARDLGVFAKVRGSIEISAPDEVEHVIADPAITPFKAAEFKHRRRK